MVLTREGQKYLCRSTYTEREMPKSAGFRWDPEKKVWWTDDSKKALRLINFADAETKAYLTKQEKDTVQSLSLSRATNANIKVPAPDGLQYLPFQKAGIAYTLARPAVLIGDEMGLGKTIEAIGVINAGPKPETVLVICPASLKVNWKRELEKWLTHKLSVGIAVAKEPFPNTDVVITNYDILDRFQGVWGATTFDYLIVDECHYMKNPGAKRTKAVLSIKAKRQIYMTGTPIVNRPKELWTVIHKLDPKTWTSFWRYAQRYCGAYHNGWGWDFSGAMNLEELQSKLRATVLVRRLKKDVLKELPDKVRQVIELPSNGFQKLLDDEWVAWKGRKEEIETLQKLVEEAALLKDSEAYREAVRALQTRTLVVFSEMAKLRHDTAVAKIPMVIAHLEDILESEDKVVVFCWHKDVIFEIKEGVENAATSKPGRRTIRQVEGIKGRTPKGESSIRDLPMRMRTGKGSISSNFGVRQVEGVSSVSSEEARKKLYPRIPYADAGEEQGKTAKGAFQDDDRRCQNTEEVSPSRDSHKGKRAQTGLFDESVIRQDHSREGLRSRKRVGNKLEGECDQAQRFTEGIGTDRSKSSNSHDSCVVITGDVSLKERQIAVDRFQNDSSCRMIIGTIGAMGLGITLTAASHVVFAELDWVPGNVSQAEDRLHRIGQKNSVLVQHLVLEDSLDAYMAKVVVRKQEVIEKALDKKSKPLPKVRWVDANPPIHSVSKTKKPAIAPSPQLYVPSSVVSEALKYLAARCDGALSLDGQGFNKMDSAFGKDLAKQTFLTPKQSETGLKLVRKYRQQLPDKLKERLKLK